jgi:uncharacterized protein
MLEEIFIPRIAGELGVSRPQVQAVADLLAQGATIPFIARYRKEATGSLDEVAVTAVRDRLGQLREIEDARAMILNSLEKHGHLTDELREKVLSADTLATLNDIYLPFKPKRRTRATMAKEKGLEPLALRIMEQIGIDPAMAAIDFINLEKGVEAVEEALAGARDIIAEMVNENDRARAMMRECFSPKPWFPAGWPRAWRKRAPNTGIILTGPSPLPVFRPIACWPCGGAKRKIFSI